MRAKTVGLKRTVERNQCGGGGVVRSSFEDHRIRVQYTAKNNMLYFIHYIMGLYLRRRRCVLPCLLGVYAIRPICSCSRWLHL